jgi:hypothetical protein
MVVMDQKIWKIYSIFKVRAITGLELPSHYKNYSNNLSIRINNS